MQGTRKSDITVDEASPPTTASARGWFAWVSSFQSNGGGKQPGHRRQAGHVAIGTKRVRATCGEHDGLFLRLASIQVNVRLVNQENTVRNRDPDHHQHAHERSDREPLPCSHQRHDDSDEADRNREQHHERQSPSDLN